VSILSTERRDRLGRVLSGDEVAHLVVDAERLGQATPSGEVALAIDRLGDVIAVLSLQPRRRGGTFANFAVFQRASSDGWEELIGNGERWPDGPRPAGAVLARSSSVTSATDGMGGHYGVIAGVVGRDITRVRVSTAADRHDVRLDSVTGSFVVLLKLADTSDFELSGEVSDGREVALLRSRSPLA